MNEQTHFSSYVARQQETQADLTETIRLRASDVVTADVRPTGATVLSGVLEDGFGTPDTVLTSTARDYGDYSQPDIGATYPASPVGACDSPGGEHGPLRWLEYQRASKHSDGNRRAELIAEQAGWPLAAHRLVWLSQSSLMLATEVKNRSDNEQPLSLSLGEFACFAMPVKPQQPSDLKINGKTLEDVEIGGRGAYEAVMDGRPLYWRDFQGQAVIDFPDGKKIEIDAVLHKKQSRFMPHMLIFHQPHTDALYLAPISGCQPGSTPLSPMTNNKRIVLPENYTARLVTAITLLRAGRIRY